MRRIGSQERYSTIVDDEIVTMVLDGEVLTRQEKKVSLGLACTHHFALHFY